MRYPTDLGLAADATRALAREAASSPAGRRRRAAGARTARGRSAGGCASSTGRWRARTGQGKPTALRLTGEAGELVERSVREARRLAAHAARAGARARRPAPSSRAAGAGAAGRARREGRDADHASGSRARRSPTGWSRSPTPTRGRSARASCGKPTEFGYVIQLAELCENTRRGARGLILPAASADRLAQRVRRCCPAPAAELDGSDLRPREVALDGGFHRRRRRRAPAPTRAACSSPAARRPGSRTHQPAPGRFRVGAEGRISHLKRRYGLAASASKATTAPRTWTAWAILAYNLDTLAIRTA